MTERSLKFTAKTIFFGRGCRLYSFYRQNVPNKLRSCHDSHGARHADKRPLFMPILLDWTVFVTLNNQALPVNS